MKQVHKLAFDILDLLENVHTTSEIETITLLGTATNSALASILIAAGTPPENFRHVADAIGNDLFRRLENFK